MTSHEKTTTLGTGRGGFVFNSDYLGPTFSLVLAVTHVSTVWSSSGLPGHPLLPAPAAAGSWGLFSIALVSLVVFYALDWSGMGRRGEKQSAALEFAGSSKSWCSLGAVQEVGAGGVEQPRSRALQSQQKRNPPKLSALCFFASDSQDTERGGLGCNCGSRLTHGDQTAALSSPACKREQVSLLLSPSPCWV